MPHYFGIILSFVALLCWCFGDFLIQKTVQLTSIWRCLLTVGISSVVLLSPFVAGPLAQTIADPYKILLLLITASLASFAGTSILWALKQGKIAIIEPVLSFHLLVVVTLSLIFKHEQLSLLQLFLIGIIFVGILMTVITPKSKTALNPKHQFENGVLWAFVGAIGMGVETFL